MSAGTHLFDSRRQVAASALRAAQSSWMKLNQAVSAYASGSLSGYAPLSHFAYRSAFDLQTLGQTLLWARIGEIDLPSRLLSASQTLADRAREFEIKSIEGRLAPSQVYFDDLLELDDLQSDVLAIDRAQPFMDTPLMPSISSQVRLGVDEVAAILSDARTRARQLDAPAAVQVVQPMGA